MLEENKNLTDQSKGSIKDTSSILASSVGGPAPYQTEELAIVSYGKINKLITALYMVTDILEKEEPLRHKLRTLGAEIITDIYLAQRDVDKKIVAIISLLDIGSTINIISEMNCNILKKEFTQLKQSTKELKQDLVLLDFFEENKTIQEDKNSTFINTDKSTSKTINSVNNINKNSIGSIGIQKGNTLLKALNEVERIRDFKKVGGMSNKKIMSLKDTKNSLRVSNTKNSFDTLKKERRDQIVKIIKEKKEQVGIKDIIFAFQNIGENMGEKTLQRELVSMVKDGVLQKAGEKRWSKYFL